MRIDRQKMHFPLIPQIEIHADQRGCSAKICVPFNLRSSAGKRR